MKTVEPQYMSYISVMPTKKLEEMSTKDVLKHAMQLLRLYAARCTEKLNEQSDTTISLSTNDIPGHSFYALCNALSDNTNVRRRTIVFLCYMCSKSLAVGKPNNGSSSISGIKMGRRSSISPQHVLCSDSPSPSPSRRASLRSPQQLLSPLARSLDSPVTNRRASIRSPTQLFASSSHSMDSAMENNCSSSISHGSSSRRASVKSAQFLSSPLGSPLASVVEDDHLTTPLETLVIRSNRGDRTGLRELLLDFAGISVTGAEEDVPRGIDKSDFFEGDTDMVSLLRDSLWDIIGCELRVNGEQMETSGKTFEARDAGRYMASPPIAAYKRHGVSNNNKNNRNGQQLFSDGLEGVSMGDLSILFNASPLRPGAVYTTQDRIDMLEYNMSRGTGGTILIPRHENDQGHIIRCSSNSSVEPAWYDAIRDDLMYHKGIRDALLYRRRPSVGEDDTQLSEEDQIIVAKEWVEGHYITHCACARCLACFMGCEKVGIMNILSMAYVQDSNSLSGDDTTANQYSTVPLKDIAWKIAVKPRVLKESERRFSFLTPFTDATVSDVIPNVGTILFMPEYEKTSVVFIHDKWFNMDVCEKTIHHLSRFAVDRSDPLQKRVS